MPIKTQSYIVEQTIAFEIPADLLRDLIEKHRNPNTSSGISKISAVGELRKWFEEHYGHKLSLLEAKHLIEKELVE